MKHTSARRAPAGDQQMRGARILCEALVNQGAEVVFGYPGGAVLNIYDELKRFKLRLRHILARHEQGAVHMAEGYALATGRTGVVIATSGPGATNTVTGIANAFMDSTPLVVITGQVARPMIGTMAFQEIDIVGITRPCTKYSYRIPCADEIAEVISEAFDIARSGRPGPVLIDIPKDVTSEMSSRCNWNSIGVAVSGKQTASKIDAREIVARLTAARRPIIYAGGGVARTGAGQELQRLAEAVNLPVATTLNGLGAIPAGHTNNLGMLGMHGTYTANCALHDSDLILAIGVRFDDRVTGNVEKFSPHAQIIHVDVDPSSVRQNIKIHYPVDSDAKTFLIEILRHLPLREDFSDLSKWWTTIRGWQQTVPLAFEASDRVIKPQQLCQVLARLTGNDAVIATDVGQHQMWLAQYYQFKRSRQSLTSGGLGTMGFGSPAALGAQIALPDQQVVAFVGDGGFQRTSQELATAVHYQTNLKVVIMNNSSLGMVRQWQELLYDRNYSEVDLSSGPDFVKLAEAYGAKGFRARYPNELENVLRKGLGTRGVVVMDIRVEPEECVFPMIPPAAGHREMRLK